MPATETWVDRSGNPLRFRIGEVWTGPSGHPWRVTHVTPDGTAWMRNQGGRCRTLQRSVIVPRTWRLHASAAVAS